MWTSSTTVPRCPIFHFSFLSILGRTFWWAQKEHLDLTIYFSSFPPNQTHFKKKFSSHFLSKVFQLPYFTSKQTHPKRGSWQNFTNGDLKDVLLCFLLIRVLLVSVTFLRIIKLDKIIQKIFILND